MSLIKKIKDYYKKGGRSLFTTPSHNQGYFLTTAAEKLLGKQFIKYDLSEIDGFDNLRNPQGAIKKLLTNISNIYGSKASFILTNGSTSGIIASMLASLKEGDKVLVARNCHISVYNGLVLSGAFPVWFLPEYDSEWGIYKGIKAAQIEKIFKEQNGIKALIITSPTYEGLFSDTEEIAKVCTRYGVIFIVDEAHGALYNFGNFKTKPAIQCGADISVQSLHKTAGAPNPCALLHISKQSSLNPDKVQKALNLINTTSPSYALLCACEASLKYLDSKKGRNDIKHLIDDINEFKKNLPDNIEVYTGFNDSTKLLIKVGGTDPERITSILYKTYGIEEEFSNDKSMLFVCGIGTNKKKIKLLNKALISINKEIKPQKTIHSTFNYTIPEIKITPREAYFKKHTIIKTKDSINRVCAKAVVKYPPGIPVLLPGEIISKKNINLIKNEKIEVCIDK